MEGKVLFMELRDDLILLFVDDLEIIFKGFGYMLKLYWMIFFLILAK